MAGIAAPLYNLLKDTNTESITWSGEEEQAFKELKVIVSANLTTHVPDTAKPFILSTDASNTEIGAVLQQEIDGELKAID